MSSSRYRGRSSLAPRVVVRDGNRISFVGRVNGFAHRQFMWHLHECRQRGYEDVVLDFSTCESAFPIGMIPLLAHADALRREAVDVSVELPKKADLERLFRNTNWAHFLEGCGSFASAVRRGPMGFCDQHGKSYLTRRRRGEGGGGSTGGTIPSA